MPQKPSKKSKASKTPGKSVRLSDADLKRASGGVRIGGRTKAPAARGSGLPIAVIK
jgi:hypothetical protein